MIEGLLQPKHLLIIASLFIEPLALVICIFLAIRSLLRIDKSLKAILAELQAQRRS
jgi:hypothetical protein